MTHAGERPAAVPETEGLNRSGHQKWARSSRYYLIANDADNPTPGEHVSS